MDTFTIHHNTAYRSGGNFKYILNVQAKILDDLNSRIVIPLVEKTKFPYPIKNLNPEVVIDSIIYVIFTQQITAVPLSYLGQVVQNIELSRSVVLSAIDFAITGF